MVGPMPTTKNYLVIVRRMQPTIAVTIYSKKIALGLETGAIFFEIAMNLRLLYFTAQLVDGAFHQFHRLAKGLSIEGQAGTGRAVQFRQGDRAAQR